uniref:Uncharacterized protein n=1 Tax=Arundo donax TaxID=35708 RepID=A0A0A9HJH9_ARUDO
MGTKFVKSLSGRAQKECHASWLLQVA